jgi:gliding motility-associated lipoprotein GldH
MKKAGLIAVVFLLCLSCDRQRVYEQFISIKDKTWDNTEILNFNVDIEDTVSAHNVYISVRNTGQYEYSNLYLFVTAVSPNGSRTTDTTEITLADERGKWLGKGSASIYTLYYPFRKNVRFPARGIYQFHIEQGMWIKDLKHINDIGLRIERARNKKR